MNICFKLMRIHLIASIALIAVSSSYGQILISNFSSIGTQAFDPFNGNWNSGSPLANQFIQGIGFISIAPVDGGNPAGDGSFDANFVGASPLNFSSISSISLTARIDAGNAISSVLIQILDSAFTQIGTAIFATASFTSSFTTVSSAFVVGGGGVITDATFWSLAGDGIASNSIRMSFDNVSAVPEPSSLALVVLGMAAVAVSRRRKSLQQPVS